MAIYSPTNLFVAESRIEGAGRGVFASSHIAMRSLVELCPVILLPKVEMPEELASHIYSFGDNLALALGYGSLYNHSDTPNAAIRKLPETGAIEFRALKDIFRLEEITVDYNTDNSNDYVIAGMSIPPFK